MKVLRLFTDGASRGNPGPAALGVVIEDDQGMRLRGFHRYLGTTTNNVAEYQALIDGLKAVEPWKPDRVEVYMDSKLVVEQVSGRYRVKSPELQVLIKQVMELKARFPAVEFRHLEREKNRGADKLANMALDEKVGKTRPRG